MVTKTKAIVISSVRYQDKSLIVKCFTQTDGLKMFFVANAFSGRASGRKIAYFQPLSMLEIVASRQLKSRLETFREIRLAHAYQTATTDIVKSSLLLFLSEVLNAGIREEEKNEELYAFLETALLWLDHHESVSNFHLIALMEMTKFLGFYPAPPEHDRQVFDLAGGMFSDESATTSLDVAQTELWKRLLGLRFESETLAFSARERQQLLHLLMEYYRLHLGNFRTPKSLEVLRELFSGS